MQRVCSLLEADLASASVRMNIFAQQCVECQAKRVGHLHLSVLTEHLLRLTRIPAKTSTRLLVVVQAAADGSRHPHLHAPQCFGTQAGILS